MAVTEQAIQDIQQARRILQGARADPEEILKCADRLKDAGYFGYAWKILTRARRERGIEPSLRRKLVQRQALCTYQDTDLPADDRFQYALTLLEEEADLRNATNQKTLGLAGAIHKRRWQLDGRKQHLEDSFAYYYRGYKVTPEEAGNDYDKGYTGINAAFVMDLMADQEAEEAKRTGATTKFADEHREQAQRIREDLLATLLDQDGQPRNQNWKEDWWFLVTVAEAYFGLRRYDEAREWLKKATKLQKVAGWQYGSTARQLASVARLHGVGVGSDIALEDSPAGKVLSDFLGECFGSDKAVASAVLSSFTGKVGLALSGGGFRASLFHIGVLAKLAELDVLPRVQVLSCVSGGSIVGAYYYLKVRRLLEEKPDGEIRPEDYVEIVEEVADEFLAGVQKNIRTRVAAEFWTNLKMILCPNYSRTERLGDLFEREIFSQAKDGEGAEQHLLNDLLVRPCGEERDGFLPKRDNWRRVAKVPTLILNATSLNTGHSWQFTPWQMGESPATIDSDIDANYLMQSVAYNDAPERYREFPLGRAVAASACVPGLFEPLVLDHLYERDGEEITVRLVDGGVYDNQGIVALLEEGCDILLVSDASGQMVAQEAPSGGLLGVPLRSNNVLMARVREAQHRHVKALARSSLLRGLMYVHLKKDLDQEPVEWIGSDEPYVPLDEHEQTDSHARLTSYGVPKEVQRRLAEIRTDLDSFNEGEAYALMTSGYRMTKQEFEFNEDLKNLPQPTEQQPQWRFLAIEQAMERARASKDFMTLLDVASHRGFKIWRLSRPLQVIAVLLGIALVVGVILACVKWWSEPVLTLGEIISTIVVVTAIVTIPPLIMRKVGYRKTLSEIGIGLGMGTLGWIGARAHLYLFDTWYLRRGSLNRVTRSVSPVPRSEGDSEAQDTENNEHLAPTDCGDKQGRDTQEPS